MKKKFSILLLLLLTIALSVYCLKIQYRTELPETTLTRAFTNSGAKVVNSEIYFWGRLGSNYDTAEQIKLLSADFGKEVGVLNNGEYSSKASETDLLNKIEVSGTDAKNRIINISIQSGKKQGSLDENFLSVDIAQDLSTSELEEVRGIVLNAFKKRKIDPKINSCITGSFEGQLDDSKLNGISSGVFEDAQARKVEGIRDGNLISVSAYSPFIGDCINVNGKKVNLNLAIRYNSLENRTYIWLATPVITTEY